MVYFRSYIRLSTANLRVRLQLINKSLRKTLPTYSAVRVERTHFAAVLPLEQRCSDPEHRHSTFTLTSAQFT
jgi:hypothetical protein